MQFVGISAWYKQLSQQADHSQVDEAPSVPNMMGCLILRIIHYFCCLTVAKTLTVIGSFYLDTQLYRHGMLAQILCAAPRHSRLCGCLATTATLVESELQAGGSGALDVVLIVVKLSTPSRHRA